ncbi:ABC transporter ATP-binding protein [bacterium]|nr:ABC transporter ATP-binding protein [bacterium]
MKATAITCDGVTKRFGDVNALDGFTLDVPLGSVLGLLGPSGSGKTTALRVIAGFERPDSGSVTVGGATMVDASTWVRPEQRKVGMVFQHYALFPHLSVARNIAYGITKGENAGGRVSHLLNLVGLSAAGDRMPHELSGGEQQRVALARALAAGPEVVLLDEPFSNLDARRRNRVRRDVRTILVEARTTAVFVTHDQEEALAMSDTVAVMRSGRVVQVADPGELYHRPSDCWVARFLGEAEFVLGTVSGGVVETALGRFPVAGQPDGSVEVMIRPEQVRLSRDDRGTGRVVDREFYGHDQVVTIVLDDGRRLMSRSGPSPALAIGDRVSVEVDEVVAFPAGPDHTH